MLEAETPKLLCDNMEFEHLLVVKYNLAVVFLSLFVFIKSFI
jgi:hypothetical protein